MKSRILLPTLAILFVFSLYAQEITSYSNNNDSRSGSYGTYIGKGAGSNATGSYNTFIGRRAGYSADDATSNVYLGYQAARANISGDRNVAIGYNVMNQTSALGSGWSDRLIIDNSNTSSPLVFGSFSSNWITFNDKVGIGLALVAPTRELDVDGMVRIRNLPVGNSETKVLVAQSDGDIYYRDVSTIGSTFDFSANHTFTGTNTFNNVSLTNVLTFEGPTSDYTIATQDGSGRVQHYWNSTTGSSPTYLVASEDAGKILFHPTSSTSLFTIYHAPPGTAGGVISWSNKFAVGHDGIGIQGNPVSGFALNVNGNTKITDALAVGGASTTSSDADGKLFVEGNIYAHEINVVPSNPWPDFVFARDYDLISLNDVENFIVKHSRLPDIPSAEEVKEDGIKVGEMNALLLLKIEELTLHLIDQNKQVIELTRRIDQLEKQ